MLIVTGTGRCGSSMWMQVLSAAGLPIVGQRFGPGQDPSLNPQGYFESALMHGINPSSNPNPVSGAELTPELPVGVKVSIPGVRLTERKYLDKVLLSVRPWRDYAASLARMHSISPPAESGLSADRAWFVQHLALLQDAAHRRLGLQRVWLPDVVACPSQVLPKVFEWLELPLDPVAGAVAIHAPQLQSGASGESPWESEILRLEAHMRSMGAIGSADLAWAEPVAAAMQTV
ncbi:MAG: hypothetical protein ACI9VR_000663 [Cognaticolwellia sp.]|jgi:hypothetical protein